MPMELYIQIRNGQPFEHPIFGDNFRHAFPGIDVDNLPPEFAVFQRVPQNVTPGPFEVAEVSYQWFDTIVKDVWSVRPMTDQEKATKIAEYQSNKPFPSWTLDETTLTYSAPTPRPQDGKLYRWDEPTLSWIEITPPPAQ
jgi:hypothetical protein